MQKGDEHARRQVLTHPSIGYHLCAHGGITHPTDNSGSTPTTAVNKTGSETAGCKNEAGAAIAADSNLKEIGNASTQDVRCICQPRMDLLR